MRSRCLPLKRFVDPSRPITYGIVQAGPDVPGGVPYIRPVDMDDHGGVGEHTVLLRTSADIARAYARSTTRSGDIIVSIGPSYGKTMVVPAWLDGANLTQGTARVAPAPQMDRRFLRWALRSTTAMDHWDASVGGATFRALNLEPLSRTPIPLVGRAAQTAIADFLDAETARIDSLVVLRKRQSRLLEERFLVAARELLAGRTGGQCWNPGPWWLGPVDRSWRPNKIAWCKVTTSGTTPDSGNPAFYDEGGVPWVTTTELREQRIIQTQRTVTQLALSEYSALRVAPPGAVLIAMYGATIGRLGVLGIWAAMNQACCAVHGDGPLDQGFLYWWLFAFREEIVGEAKGAGQPNISQETVRSLRVPAPALPEQQLIAAVIQARHETLKATQGALARQILVIQERKQALITAAVTGQLDLAREIADEAS